jgi:glutamate-1-semialdehyde 2,1-aminomutase
VTRSEALFTRARRALVGGVNSPVRAFRAVGGTPLFVKKARGARFWDADGKPYIDYVGSWGPMILGHALPAVTAAARKAAGGGASFGAPCAAEVELAEAVKRSFPMMERVRFVSSGTEATMSALRLARGYTGRPLIVKFAGCYHGHADGLLVAAGSGALTFGHPTSAGVPPEIAKLTLVLPYNDADAVRRAFRAQGRRIAAVIVEPVVGNMGTVVPRPGFLPTLRGETKKHGALLIFDEVMTGFRLSAEGAQGIFDVTPDLTCLGKIVGGGFPVGAFGGPARIMEKLAPLGPVYQAGTLSGNPVAMAAGNAMLKALARANPYDKLQALTQRLVEGLYEAAYKRGVRVTINALGSMFTVFFTTKEVVDLDTATASDTKKYARFFHGLLKRGVYFPPAQFEAAFLSAAHTPADIKKTISAADRSFQEAL